MVANSSLFSLEAYNYDLPSELIAQEPLADRSSSRLMIVDRKTGEIREVPFVELLNILQKEDRLILNDAKVIPARLIGQRPSGGKVEVFLSQSLSVDRGTWEVLIKPSKKVREGDVLTFASDFSCQVTQKLDEGKCMVTFCSSRGIDECFEKYGNMPLPPYIQREVKEEDKKRYQTCFAKSQGAVAAPTAGLHFSDELLLKIKEKGIETLFTTLYVGLGTFSPVKVDDIRLHKMHGERGSISPEVASLLNQKRGKEVCVGTTTLRILESAATEEGKILPFEGTTDIFIYPGYSFRYVKHLLTNFHMPKSSLMMLVSAFAGRELILEAYQKAIEKEFRFFSYGDGMLIL